MAVPTTEAPTTPQITMNPYTLDHVDQQVDALRAAFDREIVLLRETMARGFEEHRQRVELALTSSKQATDLRIEADRKAVEAALLTVKELNQQHDHAHDREHVSYGEAITKAEQAMNIRLEAMNNWRHDFEKMADNFARQQWVASETARIEAILARFTAELTDRRNAFDQRVGKLEAFVVAHQAGQGEQIGAVKRMESMIERNTQDFVAYRTSSASDLALYRSSASDRVGKIETWITTFQAQMGTMKAMIFIIPVVLAIASFILVRFGL